MKDLVSKNSKNIIPNLPWKHFDELILAIGNNGLTKIENYNSEIKFLEAIDFINIAEKELITSGYDIFSKHKIETKKKEMTVSLTARGKEYYTQKQIKNNEAEANSIIGESLKKHPAVILISQILSGSKNIKRINIYNLLKHHNFNLDSQKDVVLNNFLEILKLGGIVSYNKNTRDVRILWQADTGNLSSHQFISPETPYSNIKKLKDIIKSLKGKVYWIDKHFDKKAFDILVDSLDATKINHFIIISGDSNKTNSAITDFLRLQTELNNKGINMEWKIITNNSILKSIHDRWICDSNVAWNIPPVNSIFKGQESEMLKTTNRPNVNKLLKNSISVK